MAASSNHLVWMDLEMSGLDPDSCVILEIATIVTDSNLEVIAEGPDLVIHHEPPALVTLSAWCKENFGKSGLLDRVRDSEISVEEAERRTITFLRKHCKKQSSPLCGNSIHMDRAFLYRGMRKLHDFLHYRNLDVSTMKEVLKRWYPERFAPPEKAGTHVALADVRESIEEMRYYRREFFPPVSERAPSA